VSTVIHDAQHGKAGRKQHWDRIRRAELLEQYGTLQAQGLSQRQAAKTLDVPRTTLQAWRAWQARLDACPQVVEFFESVPGLAFRHRLVLACHVVCVEIGAGGIRLVCLW
jgi:Psq-like protein